jgi:Flp pilus assembly pilin Flp
VVRGIVLRLEELRKGEEGQGLVEYSLILVFVSVVGIAALGSIGGSISNILQSIAQTLSVP